MAFKEKISPIVGLGPMEFRVFVDFSGGHRSELEKLGGSLSYVQGYIDLRLRIN